MGTELERHRAIAESLIAVPRYLGQDKIRRLGVEGVAKIVAGIATDPDEYTRKLANEAGGWTCAVCEKSKYPGAFGQRPSSGEGSLRVCMYCRWRIKSKADSAYRAEKGLPVKPSRDPDGPKAPLGPEQSEALDAFLHAREGAKPYAEQARICLPKDVDVVDSVYAPDFAGISSGWYGKSNDQIYGRGRQQIASWWTANDDAVIEWFLGSYGMFVLAACPAIESEIRRLHGIAGAIDRHFDYFVLDRIRTQPRLWNLYASDLASRHRLMNVCAVCGKPEPLVGIHPENLAATHGRVLPLCDLHWKTYLRSKQPGDVAAVPAVEVSVDSALRTHTCPVCGCEHSWKDSTYTYTPGFYGIPPVHREICANCFGVAVNKQPRSYATKRDLDGILEISRIIEGLPDPDPFKVITAQAKTIDAAAAVVRHMTEMVRFGTLKRKHGSWFAVLAKSGCLPEGSRKETFGTRILAKDGHECLSMAEMQIDNELHRLRIPHRKEVPYPNASFRCDWVVEGEDGVVFIEYFGLSGQAAYDEKIVKKRAALAQAGVALLELYADDLPILNERFASLTRPPASRKRAAPPDTKSPP